MNPPTTLTNHNPPATIGCGLNPNPIRREESDTPHIAVTRSRYCPHTQAHIAKRTAEGKTPREAQRCLKRYIARQIYRLLQHPKINT